MSEDRFLELVPLAALGALDGRENAEFQAHARDCLVCHAELEIQERLVALIPQSTAPVAPSPAVRRGILEAVGPAQAERVERSRTGGRLYAALATAAALALGIGLLITRGQREAARRDAEAAQEASEASSDQARQALAELETLRKELVEERALSKLVADPVSRVTSLNGRPPAPNASGRVVWNPRTREAILMASGLASAPAGKTYEVWVIARAPFPAGVFAPRSDGTAVFRLSALEATVAIKTFAVTLEPAGGVRAPTGPMVLAGPVS